MGKSASGSIQGGVSSGGIGLKFSFKLLFSTIILLALSLGASGFYFVNYVFRTSLEREVQQAMDETGLLSFAFETAVLNIPTKYPILPQNIIEEIISSLEREGQDSGRRIRLSDSRMNMIYQSEEFDTDQVVLEKIGRKQQAHRIIKKAEEYYIHTAMFLEVSGHDFYLETLQDITQIFEEKDLGFLVYRRVTLVLLVLCIIIMYSISAFLTKPIKILREATTRMAEEQYRYRANKISDDELGLLTEDFNKMAEKLQENMEKLEEEVRAKEDFIAAFAHELKTPLTAIIGYADMLRSKKMEEDMVFLSANYIHKEGKRLEKVAFCLLDIIVKKRLNVTMKWFEAKEIFFYLNNVYKGMNNPIIVKYDVGKIWGEEELVKTVILNLVDNAIKASEENDEILIRGRKEEKGYYFEVRDHGIGIDEGEQKKILEPFYMIDKSRSRKANGAGLGLTLCVEILKIHHSRLEIKSEKKKGSAIGFFLPNPRSEERDEIQERGFS